ncbi:uncharacterized protein LOC123310140 [Coccinella septempunctata]|uniref:uncharacterized protein LOC123310140 n=1 Tax=Coccinella septempunctata TaxID=41139 RepID=UPI001D09135F|nr:uncharacterized protein LOC123310140 [Coccinella septempunctata]
MRHLSIVLLAIAFIQAVTAETIPEVVQEFSTVIDNRTSEVGQLIGIVGRNVGQIFGQIQKNVKEVGQNLNDYLEHLKNYISASASRAGKLGQNIDDCVSTATSSLSSLNLDVLQKCAISNELTDVQKMIPRVADLQRQLRTLIPRCMVGTPEDETTIRACLSDGLQQIDASAESLTADVRTLIDGALDTAENCVEGVRSDLQNSMSSVNSAFNDCVGIL